MTENKCKSLENLLPIISTKLSHTKLPDHFETYRNELHRELTKHWPFHNATPNSSNIAPIASKSSAQTTIRDENDISHKTSSYLRTNNLTSSNSFVSNKKKLESKDQILPMTSDFSLNDLQKRPAWNLKAQEGVIRYQLPDNLPDSFALQNKLQTLMKTNSIYLNDRRFWTKLENRFKNLRKQNFQQNMERLRQNQQQYEQELISKGLIPHTTEEAMKQYAEEQKSQIITEKTDLNESNLIKQNCLTDYSSLKSFDKNLLNKTDELDAFESDNVHPKFHQILNNYEFQTQTGKELNDKFQNNLHQIQKQIKTIFPKTNQRDFIRQELEAIKTSEGLYAYSNRLAKQIAKS